MHASCFRVVYIRLRVSSSSACLWLCTLINLSYSVNRIRHLKVLPFSETAKVFKQKKISVLSYVVVLRLWEKVNFTFSLTIWCLTASVTGLVTKCLSYWLIAWYRFFLFQLPVCLKSLFL